MAGITWWQFYFRVFPGSIRGPQVVEFLRHLRRQIPRRLLVIWDRLPAHRSRVVQDYIEAQGGHIVLEYLPAYAPELNPAEYVWGYWKQHEMANFCPKDFAQLGTRARRSLRRMQRHSTLVTAFWKQADLFE